MPALQLPTGTCLVVNGDFETGELPPWTNTGDTSFTAVDANNPHSGTFSLETGPATSDGFIDQVIPTVAGTAYDVSFWLENQDTTGNNRFGASFGGITLVPEATQAPFGYTLYTFNNVMPGANADLHFIFYNPPSFFYLDDVCVTVSGPSPTPTCPPVINEGFDDITCCLAGLCSTTVSHWELLTGSRAITLSFRRSTARLQLILPQTSITAQGWLQSATGC
jgi:hypothetical protein